MSQTERAQFLRLYDSGDAAVSDGHRRNREVAARFRAAFESLGLDLGDPHLRGTDLRVARAYRQLLAGLYAGAAPRMTTFPNREESWGKLGSGLIFLL